MPAAVRLSVPAELARLPELTAFALDAAGQWGIGSRQCGRLRLVLEELFVNICHYGGPAQVSLTLEIEETHLCCRLADTGQAFDPLQNADGPEPEWLPLEDRPIGGVGLHLVRTLCADCRYTRENNENVIWFSLLRHD